MSSRATVHPWGSPPKFHDDPGNLRYEPERGQWQARVLKRRSLTALLLEAQSSRDMIAALDDAEIAVLAYDLHTSGSTFLALGGEDLA